MENGNMTLIDLIDEDFINYKKRSMVLGFPKCNMKCGCEYCQNAGLLDAPHINTSCKQIIQRYMKNEITEAIVCQGLEPLDSFYDLLTFIDEFRKVSNDDIVIYTGYTKCEISEQVNTLKQYPNIIIKFGRYVPGQQPHYDEVLGVDLASDNQYAEKIS